MFDIQLECFFSLSKTLNFSETAKQLFMSQQAVSKNIAKLESNIGFPLFFRNSHSVKLTTWGEEYLKICKTHLKAEAEILEDYQASNSIFKILTLNQPDFVPVKNIHPYKIPGSDYNANIQIYYDTPAVEIQRLLDREVDMVVTIDRFINSTSGIVVYPIFDLEAALLVSRNHPKYKENLPFSAYKNEAFIAGVPSNNFFETRDSITRDIEHFGLNPRSIIIVANAEEALAAAARGEGIILGSVMAKPSYDEQLATVPTGEVNKIVCVWNETHSKSFSEDFAIFLQEEFKKAELDLNGDFYDNPKK